LYVVELVKPMYTFFRRKRRHAAICRVAGLAAAGYSTATPQESG